MDTFNNLHGLTLLSINGASKESNYIVFKSIDGRMFSLQHYQDCCETVYIEDIIGDISDLLNTPILHAEERSNYNLDEEWDGIEKYTFYEISTIKGSVTIRWFGSSNGYYGASVSFEEITT